MIEVWTDALFAPPLLGENQGMEVDVDGSGNYYAKIRNEYDGRNGRSLA